MATTTDAIIVDYCRYTAAGQKSAAAASWTARSVAASRLQRAHVFHCSSLLPPDDFYARSAAGAVGCWRRCATIDLSTRTVLSVGRPRLRGRRPDPAHACWLDRFYRVTWLGGVAAASGQTSHFRQLATVTSDGGVSTSGPLYTLCAPWSCVVA